MTLLKCVQYKLTNTYGKTFLWHFNLVFWVDLEKRITRPSQIKIKHSLLAIQTLQHLTNCCIYNLAYGLWWREYGKLYRGPKPKSIQNSTTLSEASTVRIPPTECAKSNVFRVHCAQLGN